MKWLQPEKKQGEPSQEERIKEDFSYQGDGSKNENRQRRSEMLDACPPLGTPTLDSFPV